MKRKPEYSVTTWADLYECVVTWGEEKGVRVSYRVEVQPLLPLGAYAEVVLYDAEVSGAAGELLRTRCSFPIRKGAGHAGALLYATFEALNALDREPWSWSRKMRREARDQA